MPHLMGSKAQRVKKLFQSTQSLKEGAKKCGQESTEQIPWEALWVFGDCRSSWEGPTRHKPVTKPVVRGAGQPPPNQHL